MMKILENRITLVVVYGTAVLLVVAVGVLAAVRLGRISAALDDLTTDLAADIVLSKEIVNQVLLTRFHAQAYVGNQAQADFDRFKVAFSRLQNLLSQADRQITAPQRVEMLRQIDPAVESYGATFDQIATLIRRQQETQSEVLDVQALRINENLTGLRMHALGSDDPRAFLAVTSARDGFQSMRYSAARYLENGDARYAVLFEAGYQEVQTALANLEDALDAPSQRISVATLSAAVETYRDGFQDIRTDFITVRDLMSSELDALERKISDTASAMVNSVEMDFQRENALSQRLVRQTRLVLGFTTAIATIASLGLGIVFSRRMAERARAEKALRAAHDQLEVRVEERTAELEQAYTELQERRLYLEAVLEAAPDAIVTVGSDKRIAEWNTGAEELFGYPRQEVIGQSLDRLITTPDVFEEAVELTQALSRGQELPPTEAVRYRKDGTPVDVIMAASPIMADGEFLGIVGVYTDITQRVQVEEQLERYASELEQANEEIKQFAYIVSHDLRAPLVNLKGFSAELRFALEEIESTVEDLRPQLDPDQRQRLTYALDEDVPEALSFIESSVTRMDAFINAVLRLSRLGRRELDLEPVDPQDLVSTVVDSLAHQIEERGAEVIVGPLPQVVADHTSMEQIFGNLLNNAVKYLEPDRPGKIEISGEREGDVTAFHVRDNGRGIAEGDMEKVFAPFRRAGTQDRPGEGMGLPYVQALVRRHGGRIWCESQLGVGTTMHFTISNHLQDGGECA